MELATEPLKMTTQDLAPPLSIIFGALELSRDPLKDPVPYDGASPVPNEANEAAKIEDDEAKFWIEYREYELECEAHELRRKRPEINKEESSIPNEEGDAANIEEKEAELMVQRQEYELGYKALQLRKKRREISKKKSCIPHEEKEAANIEEEKAELMFQCQELQLKCKALELRKKWLEISILKSALKSGQSPVQTPLMNNELPKPLASLPSSKELTTLRLSGTASYLT